jgi:hypothetical protein
MVEQILLPVVLKNNGYCERAVDQPVLQNYQTVSFYTLGALSNALKRFQPVLMSHTNIIQTVFPKTELPLAYSSQ